MVTQALSESLLVTGTHTFEVLDSLQRQSSSDSSDNNSAEPTLGTEKRVMACGRVAPMRTDITLADSCAPQHLRVLL